jgi:hypothetical protein
MLPLCFSSEDVFNHILSFVDTLDIMHMLMANRELSRVTLSVALENKEIEIRSGSCLVSFCLWAKKHHVQKIKRLEIRHVDCTRYSYIKEEYVNSLKILQDIDLKTLVLVKMNFGEENLIPRRVENLYIKKCFPVKMQWINRIENLQVLSIHGQQLKSFCDMKTTGLQVCVKTFSTNYLQNVPEMLEFFGNSLANEKMTEFSFDMPIEDRKNNEPLLKQKIKEIFPKIQIIREIIGSCSCYW